jgi:hypothetical protein
MVEAMTRGIGTQAAGDRADDMGDSQPDRGAVGLRTGPACRIVTSARMALPSLGDQVTPVARPVFLVGSRVQGRRVEACLDARCLGRALDLNPVGEVLAFVWRRWWRRMRGG